MKRLLKFLLSTSSLATAIIASATLVTSCSLEELKESSKETDEKDQRDSSSNSNNDNDPRKNLNDDKSRESNDLKPESSITTIDSKSISLSNLGNLLPSQYLKSILSDSLELSNELIIKNFDSSKVSNVSYVLNSLDDSKGTLSLRMNYLENNQSKSFLFEFNGLLSMNQNKQFNLQFEQKSDQSKLLYLSKLLETKKHNKEDSNNLIQKFKENDINLKLLQNGSSIPLEYLDIDEIDVSGFNESWFTSPNEISINLNLKNPKINFFVKNLNDSSIIKKTFLLPTNTNKKLNLTFKSALDYFLSKITANSDYTGDKDKYAEYYYYDLLNNRNNNISSNKLSNSAWLANVINEVDYNNKKFMYKVDYANDYSSNINANGSLNINIILTCENETNSFTSSFSATHKTINLNFFKKHIEKVFRYDGEIPNGKFWFSSDASDYDDNLKKIKKRSSQILKTISQSREKEIKFLSGEIDGTILNTIANKFKLMFSNDELNKIETNNGNYYSNERVAIENYFINKNDICLVYDIEYDVFKIHLKLGISSEGFKDLDESDYIGVIISKPGKSLDDLKKN